MATALALAITLFVFVFVVVPASGIYAFLDIQPDEFANLSPIMSTDQILRLDARRNGQQGLVSRKGLITFPSFQIVWALLFMWAFHPIKQLRFGAIVLNLLVSAAMPVVGAHYFIDLVGGTIVAAIAIVGTARFARSSLANTATQTGPGVALDVTKGPPLQASIPPPYVWAEPACNLFAPIIVKSPMLTPASGTTGASDEDIHSRG